GWCLSNSVRGRFSPAPLFSITIALNLGTCPLHSYARKLYRAAPAAATRCPESAPLRLSLRDAPTFAIDREIGIEHEDGVPVIDFGHPHDARIREGHRPVPIFLMQLA